MSRSRTMSKQVHRHWTAEQKLAILAEDRRRRGCCMPGNAWPSKELWKRCAVGESRIPMRRRPGCGPIWNVSARGWPN